MSSEGYALGRMQQVLPLLWIGDINAAWDTEGLRENGIHSILTVYNTEIEVHPTFLRHHIIIEDSDDADILTFLPAAVAFIDAEKTKGRGVLVHCLAGVSRSATVVAAYLMYSQNIKASEALEKIRSVRPQIGPNDGFLRQLEIFYEAAFKLSLQDKSTRMYYLEQAVKRIQSGHKVSVKGVSGDLTSEGRSRSSSQRERRVRCKMCRQDLAGRDNMVGHRLPSEEQQQEEREDNAPVVTTFPLEVAAPAGLPNIRARRSSAKAPNMSGLASLKMSSIEPGSAVMDDDGPPVSSPSAAKLLAERQRRSSAKGSKLSVTDTVSNELAQKLSDALTLEEEFKSEGQAEVAEGAPTPNAYVSPGIAATSLSDKLASLRGTTSGDSSSTPPLALPVLADPQCSGYFLEPMKWMDSYLEGGDISGKILCPNPRCKAKVGNFAWTGMHCSCHDWVVPGFCISRSKVDEVIK